MKAQKYICSAILALLSILSIVSAVFIARSAFGLPLDDAYIFLKYAENLSLDHGFSFNPGETSFGCTSFLWPVLVSLFLRFIAISHYTFLVQSLGIIFFGASVFLAGWIMRSLKAHPLFAAAAAVLTAASPVMFMNAVSGMETPLLILEVLILFMLLSRARPPMVLIGLLTGLIFLTRPEGLYFALAIPIAWLIKKWRDPDETVNSAVINPLLRFFAPFIILAIPYVAFVWKNTGSFLPTTYRGKIMAADPGLLDRPFLENLVHALLSLVDGWRRLLEPAGLVVGLTLILFAAALGIWILIRLAKKIETDPALLSLIVMLGFLLLPAAYGYAFRVHPAFGGYYNRYIACVLPCFAILGCLGMDRLYNLAADRIPFLFRHKTIILSVGFILFLAYSARIYYHQYPSARRIYQNEVSLNEGVRKQAALWIRKNTPPDARVLVGYTGLGVVGALCERYVLDMGALINPDIFDYYEDTLPMSEKRWERIKQYIQDQKITHYVTFFGPGPAPDPALTPGFREVAKIGSQSDMPEAPYNQVRIYMINLEP